LNATSTAFSDINQYYLMDETLCVRELLQSAHVSDKQNQLIQSMAARLVMAVRDRSRDASGLQAFLQEYDLSSHEGIVLMCLAESLLRIPDNATMDALIADKLSSGNWQEHLGNNKSLFVNASTWALMLTGRMIKPERAAIRDPAVFLSNMVTRLEEPVVRAALRSAMHIMGHQFVMGETITAALARSQTRENHQYRYSFDMLGEAALSEHDADRYQEAYRDAINSIAASVRASSHIHERPGISIKLSALCPRFEYSQQHRALDEMSRRLLDLAGLACSHGISLTVDAEESNRLELTLQVFESIYRSQVTADWPGLGLAVQSYQKRAGRVLRWLEDLAADGGKVIPVRLVKGAYWDAEIKACQEQGLTDYPVFTRKCNTDVSYLACARLLLDSCPSLYPQFATHNAHTVAYVYHVAGNREYEFQRLHGMGEELYRDIIDQKKFNVACRVYAPVGSYDDLLPYLVRRLLENGANTSFVNQMAHEQTTIESIIADPVATVTALGDQIRHPRIPLPARIFPDGRMNSAGLNFADAGEISPLLHTIAAACEQDWIAMPVIAGENQPGELTSLYNPARLDEKIGRVGYASSEMIIQAIDSTAAAWSSWNATDAGYRAGLLEQAADLYEQCRGELIARCVREAGRTIPDSHAELREAVDLLRYYAGCCRTECAAPLALPGPAGESNQLRTRGRGVFLCISPWNFPLAIFTGQIAAALAAGNTVIAKPAEQTSLTAYLATQLLYRAGVPAEVLAFIPATGDRFGDTALNDKRVAGVAFTGSTATAHRINLALAQRSAALPTVIAETGGLNVMIADSSALPDQLIPDVARSAFNSAGQRCSSLRVLYLQEDIYDRVIVILTGYMEQLVIGDPMELASDIGPIIDAEARHTIVQHVAGFRNSGGLIFEHPFRQQDNSLFLPPAVIELQHISQLQHEVFGPVLHVIRYRANELGRILDDVNATGYGLTLGIHSRIESRVEFIRQRVNVGNIYVNRNMIGATVGVQPFGGMGLSGTGPKAGGPNYLKRFVAEQTFTVNTTAVGGNASLLSLNQ